MKLRVAQLKKVVAEALMRGVQEHQFVSATRDYVENIEQLLRRHILLDKSMTPIERERAFQQMSSALKDLEKEAIELLDDKLQEFMRAT